MTTSRTPHLHRRWRPPAAPRRPRRPAAAVRLPPEDFKAVRRGLLLVVLAASSRPYWILFTQLTLSLGGLRFPGVLGRRVPAVYWVANMQLFGRQVGGRPPWWGRL